MFRASAAPSPPAFRAEHASLSGRVHAALPAPDVGWAQGEVGLLGWGVADELEARAPAEVDAALDRVLGSPPADGPWLGGWAFDLFRTPAAPWAEFPLLRFVLPEVVLSWDPAGATLSCCPRARTRAREVADAWSRRAPSAPPAHRAAWEEGDRTRWRALHARALQSISAGTLDKVVIARAVCGTVHASPLEALLSLAEGNPTSRAFLFRNGAGAFVGATPETLCRLEGDRLETEALAGTAPLAEAETLLRSDKDLREHAHVVTAILAALEGKVSDVQRPAGPEVLRLPRLAHLRTPITARLPDRSTLPRLARALHPTPAVNGLPREPARAFLLAEEGLGRGWFSGVVGCIQGGAVELRVALRCALLADGGAAVAFAGAGVVAGSTADGEWMETARKLRTVQAALAEEQQPHV